jgi:formylglycine-generating enzyme required for sulfatase activity
MRIVYLILLVTAIRSGLAQEKTIAIKGRVLDVKSNLPLASASVSVTSGGNEVVAREDGTFDFYVPENAAGDSVVISHIGYKSQKKRIADIRSPVIFLLEDFSVELRAVTVTSRNLNLKEIDRSLRRIRGNLFAYDREITNSLYNLFMSYLEEHDQAELVEQCKYDLSGYDEKSRAFYENYTAVFVGPVNKKDTTTERDYSLFPAVNISHGAAVVFCQWLTEQYNTNPGKKKFKKIKFKLPSLKEWQIAALGYDEFQSWNLDENKVEVVVPSDTLAESGKGKKTVVPVGPDFLYPWWNHYHYRNRPAGVQNCFLGNFKVTEVSKPCGRVALPNHDGWSRMSITTSYFPNGMGLYDVVGNVAEMIDEKGKACGGSWNDPPQASTIRSVRSYKRPDASIGFRIFMEVVEE